MAKVLSFSFSTSPSNDYSGLISFRIDRFDLLAVQRTLKSLLQHHNSKHIQPPLLWKSHMGSQRMVPMQEIKLFLRIKTLSLGLADVFAALNLRKLVKV